MSLGVYHFDNENEVKKRERLNASLVKGTRLHRCTQSAITDTNAGIFHKKAKLGEGSFGKGTRFVDAKFTL